MPDLLERRIGREVIPGDAFTHECPVCFKRFRYGHAHEPLCTGPSESSDDHEPTVMRLVRVDKNEVNPVLAERLALGPLILPDGFRTRG